MRKTITGIVLLALLGATAYFLGQKDKKAAQVRDIMQDRAFTVEEEEIQKIFVAHKTMKPYTLTRKGDSWYYNDDMKVDEYVMPNILQVLTKVEINHIPPKTQVETIVNSMRRGGIKVEVYGDGDEKLRTYFVGSDVGEGRGTYMLLEGSNQPYAMELPNINGGWRHRLMFTRNQLQDATLFSIPAEDITQVSIDYPTDQDKSVLLERTKDGFTITNDKYGTQIANADIANGYLGNYAKVSLEGWDNGNRLQDSIAQLTPFVDVQVTTKDGSMSQMKLVPFRDFIDPDLNIEEHAQSQYVFRYFVVTEDGSLGLGQQRLLGKLLVPYEFFLASS